MQKSESIKNLAKALITFHVKVTKVNKDATNPFFKSKYASLSNILEAINEPLIESGLTFSQFPTSENGLTTILMHGESGEFIESTYDMKPVKDDPQGRGSAITYQRRYAMAAVLGLNIDDDDDGNAASVKPINGHESKENDDKKWLNKDMPEFASAINKIKAGTSSIEALRKYFKISKAVEAAILAETQKVPA